VVPTLACGAASAGTSEALVVHSQMEIIQALASASPAGELD
jgi:hypothetical protein